MTLPVPVFRNEKEKRHMSSTGKWESEIHSYQAQPCLLLNLVSFLANDVIPERNINNAFP